MSWWRLKISLSLSMCLWGTEYQTLPVSSKGQGWDEVLSRALGGKEEELTCERVVGRWGGVFKYSLLYWGESWESCLEMKTSWLGQAS